jgi:signal transduction histidine kinase
LARLLALLAAWTLIGTVSFARRALDGALPPMAGQPLWAYAEWLTCYLPWGLLSAGLFPLEARFPLGRARWVRHVAVLATASVPVAYVAWLLTAVCELAVAGLSGRPSHAASLSWTVPPADLVGHALLYWATIAAAAAIRTLREAREAERRAAQLLLDRTRLESSLRQAELEALRMRLQPHFLFNSLQNISVLVRHYPETGSRMLTKLGDLLRAALARDGEAETSLESEIALTEAYLAVEEMRFGDRLSSRIAIAPEAAHARVPTFLLQPLVENALRHGLRQVRQGGLVEVRAAIDGDRLVLTVADNGAGLEGELSTAAYGIGLGATAERLARMYPGAHTLTLRGRPEGGAEVRVTLPLQRHRQAAEAGPAGAPGKEADAAAARAHRR